MTSCMLRLTSKVPKILLLLPPGQSKEPACQLRRHKRHRFTPWVRKVPWRRAWQPTPVFLPGDSHGQRSLEGCSPWGRRELGTMERLSSSRTIQWPSAWRQGTLVLCVQTTQQLCTLRPPQVSASPTEALSILSRNLTLKETGSLQWAPSRPSQHLSPWLSPLLSDTRTSPWLSKSELPYLPAKFPTVLRTGLGVRFYLYLLKLEISKLY